MLQLIKLLHTIIWAFFAALIFLVLYAAITGIITTWTWIAIVLILAECVVLLLNGWACPLTAIAAKYTAAREDNFDIYLPLCLARYNKLIFSVLLAMGLLGILARMICIG